MLHPAYRDLLQSDQLEAGKAHLIETIHQIHSESDSELLQPENEEQTQASPASTMADQPKAKRFKHVARLLEEKQKEPTDEDSSVPVEKAELNEYLKKPISLEEDEDPFKFWTTNTAYASI